MARVRSAALRVTTDGRALRIGERFAVTFQRTLRIPDDGGIYPLPPGLGAFPIRRVEDYLARVPGSWRERGGFFLPMYQREAMWLAFDCAWWSAAAVQIGVGGVCALTGRRLRRRLNRTRARQNYVVCPDQPWLDGIHAGDGFIRQFVAAPLGKGWTVEGQITGKEDWGGVQLRVVEPKPGIFQEEPGPSLWGWASPAPADGLLCCETSIGMGLGAGGRMRQKVYPDPHGPDTWDEERSATVFVHVANSEAWRAVTGEPPPPTPVSARTYTEWGLPWFDLYDEGAADLRPSKILAGVRSLAELAGGDAEDVPVEVGEGQVVGLVGPTSVPAPSG